MSTKAQAGVTTQVFEIYINATAEAVWDAVTTLLETGKTMGA
jgi:hypothetical protein